MQKEKKKTIAFKVAESFLVAFIVWISFCSVMGK